MYTNNLDDNLIVHKVIKKDIDKDKNEMPFKLGPMISAIDNITMRDFDSVEWVTTKDGRLTDLTIYFNVEEN